MIFFFYNTSYPDNSYYNTYVPFLVAMGELSYRTRRANIIEYYAALFDTYYLIVYRYRKNLSIWVDIKAPVC